VLDVPNLDDPFVVPRPDPICDDAIEPLLRRRELPAHPPRRDRCIADHLLTFYERETDTLVFRPCCRSTR
jgi:hypothetical protein